MEKELKELILKLKSAGLNSDVKKLQKFANAAQIDPRFNEMLEALYSYGGEKATYIKENISNIDNQDFLISLEDIASNHIDKDVTLQQLDDNIHKFFRKKFDLLAEVKNTRYAATSNFITKIKKDDPLLDIIFDQIPNDLSEEISLWRGNYSNTKRCDNDILFGVRYYAFQYGTQGSGNSFISLVFSNATEESFDLLRDDLVATIEAEIAAKTPAKKETKPSDETRADKSYVAPSVSRYQKESGESVTLGDKGPNVRNIQLALKDKDYLTADQVDGALGPVTHEAIFKAIGLDLGPDRHGSKYA